MSEDVSLQTELHDIMSAFYTALEDDSINRKWKKKAVTLMVEIDTLQRELKDNIEVPGDIIKKTINQGEDLLNQLNRY